MRRLKLSIDNGFPDTDNKSLDLEGQCFAKGVSESPVMGILTKAFKKGSIYVPWMWGECVGHADDRYA